ncbi:hypothetical protein GCM10010973_36080 [Cribrihabitans marinus]|nr:hypothetical protein GCM10010973_36080 [Cribrihabitans marinus]
MRDLSESAFDFLERSVAEIETHPKYSVIHFATAVELILKARLMREHWTLVVERTSDVTLNDFLSGKAKTATQADAIKRLKNACGENIASDAVAQFEKIAAHRNRMIHFFHEAGRKEADDKLTEEIVKEICLSWFHLDRLFSEWSDQFDAFQAEIASVDTKMKGLREFLKVTFERLKPEISTLKKAGTAFNICAGCGFEAAAVEQIEGMLFEQRCKVCGLGETYLEIPCLAECGTLLHIEAEYGSDRTCPNCEYDVTADDLAEVLDTEGCDPSDFHMPINCAYCSSLGTVVQHHEIFICTECLERDVGAPTCEWCNEAQIGGGDLEHGHYTGCEFCDGHAG